MSLIKKCLCVLFLLLINGKLYSGYHEEGLKYYNYKKYDKAREMFLKSIEASDNGNSYFLLGEIEKNEGNLDKAEEYYKLSISKNIINKYKKVAYWNIIVFEEQKGRYNEMVVVCKDLWEKMNDDGAKKKVEALINKFLWSDNEEAKLLYNNGIEYKEKNNPEKAKEAFINALRIDSNFLASKFEIGLIYLNQNNISQAIDYLKDIVGKIPFYGEVHLLLGDIYYNKQSYNNSIDHFGKGLEYAFLDNKTKYSIRLKIGTSCFELGDSDRAEEEFKQAIELNNKALEPLLWISSIYIKKNNFELALSSLLKAREINPNNLEILYQLGSIYYKINDQKYLYYFQQLFNKTTAIKDTVPQKYLKAFTLLLKNYFDNKKYEDALKIVDFLPDVQKNNEINNMTAKSYYYIRKYARAIEFFERLPLNNEDKYLLCISYARTGMLDKAKDILKNLVGVNDYLEKAKSDVSLKKIAAEIDNEKAKKEDELIKAQEEEKKIKEQERINEEKIRIEKEESLKRLNEKSNETVNTGQESSADQSSESGIGEKINTADHGKQ